MVKQLVKLKLNLSFFLLVSASVFAGSEPAPQLSQSDLSKPQVIKQWLMENAHKVDSPAAQEYFKMGDDYANKKNWSAAAKSYGESALVFPAPKTLHGYANAELKMLGIIRTRNKGPNAKAKSDLEYILTLYQTTLAADDVLKVFTPSERKNIELNTQCVTDFIQGVKSTVPCKPLQEYGALE